MQKSIEVKPRFLLVMRQSNGNEQTAEFETEKELRAAALESIDRYSEVVAYRISNRSSVGSYVGLNLRWK